MKTIKELAIKWRCDKAAPEHHTYDLPYEFHFGALRDKPIKLLEIGAGGYDNPKEGGASLRLWKEYFNHPQTQIFSIDIFEKSAIEEDRIKIWQGSQNDEEFLNNVILEMGVQPDIIIDDGSHVHLDILASFKILFHKLKTGGVYVWEDCQTAYWNHYGGSISGLNAVDYFKGFIDGLNYKEIATEERGNGIKPQEPDYFNLNITSIHFYHNLVFIYKGDNSITA